MTISFTEADSQGSPRNLVVEVGNRPKPSRLVAPGVVAALVIAVLGWLVFRPSTEAQPVGEGADTSEPEAASAAAYIGAAASRGAAPQLGSDAGETTLVVDESDLGKISLEVPSEWSDAVAADMVDGSVTGRGLTVSTDTEAYFEGFVTPGLWLAVVENPDLDTAAFLDELEPPAACAYEGRVPVSAEGFQGHHEVYRDCGGGSSSYWVGALQLGDFAVYFDANLPDVTAAAAVDAALASLEVDR